MLKPVLNSGFVAAKLGHFQIGEVAMTLLF